MFTFGEISLGALLFLLLGILLSHLLREQGRKKNVFNEASERFQESLIAQKAIISQLKQVMPVKSKFFEIMNEGYSRNLSVMMSVGLYLKGKNSKGSTRLGKIIVIHTAII